jgi:hypothetical protein
MRQLSKLKHSRNQWQAKQDLKAPQSLLRQLESHTQVVAVRPQVDVVWLCL